MASRSIQEEVDLNYEAFRVLLPQIIGVHRDRYALMKDGKIVNYFTSAEDARVAAESFIKDGLFSIQHVTDASINLGFFNYAVHGDSLRP